MSKKATPQLPECIRQFDFKVRAAGEGEPAHGGLDGIFNMIGELDSYWTVSHPRSKGFTPEGLNRFVKEGKVLSCHRSSEPPVGWVDACNVSEREVQGTIFWHSTPRGQEWRTIAVERHEEDRTVGLSIGFEVSRYMYFETGDDMVKFLSEEGEDMKMFNVEQIKAHRKSCWLMWVDRIYEVSPCNFQANEPSISTGTRAKPVLGEILASLAERGFRATESELLECAREAGIIDQPSEADRSGDMTAEDLAKFETARAALEKGFTKR